MSATRLLLIQATQTATLMGIGDVIAQMFVEEKPLKKVNLIRTAQFAGVGLLFVGPTLGTWYKILHVYVDQTKPLWVLKKVALDQLCFAPCFLATFLTVLNVMEGRNWTETKQQLKLKYKDVLLTNYIIWPATQLINFNFMPLKHQVLLVQCVAVFWNVYLSWKSSHGKSQ